MPTPDVFVSAKEPAQWPSLGATGSEDYAIALPDRQPPPVILINEEEQ